MAEEKQSLEAFQNQGGAGDNAVNKLEESVHSNLEGELVQGTNPRTVEVPLDIREELSRLISEQKFEEAFTAALKTSGVSIVSWLCSQVDLLRTLSVTPISLSQGVLLALLHRLACDNKEMSRNLPWMTAVALAINPNDPMIAKHAVQKQLEQVCEEVLSHHRAQPVTTTAEAKDIVIFIYIIKSRLSNCHPLEHIGLEKTDSNVSHAFETSDGFGALDPGQANQIPEMPLAIREELSRLISGQKFEEAFTAALKTSGVSIVSWLCSQVDLPRTLSVTPISLSQGVLMALLHRLACDNKEMSRNLPWMTAAALAINPNDPMIAKHAVQKQLEQVCEEVLNHHRTQPVTTTAEAKAIVIFIYIIKSRLSNCHPLEHIGLEKTDSNVSHAFETSDGFGALDPGQANQIPEMTVAP